MSLKDLFKEANAQYLSAKSLNNLTGNIESAEYIEIYLKNKERFVPLVDYSEPKNFARFGSAEKYYYDSINYILNTYPYDGSKKEKVLWEFSSSHLDLYLFDKGYPRSTGYAVFSTSSLTATDTSLNYGAAGTASYEYVFVNGGPHAGTGKTVYIDPDSGEAKYREDANIYKYSKNRECNLKIGGTDGNTVEFWLKKAAFDPDATNKEVIFDAHTTSSISSSDDYGRLRIEMSGHGVATGDTSPFYVTYMSGSDGIQNYNIGASVTTSSIADDSWHHYAFRFKNSGSNVLVDLFVDGAHNDRVSRSQPINYVSGTIVGTIGALATFPSGTQAGVPQAQKGWGKLSGSIDEFRYWKVWRSAEQIQTRWFDQVGGGTNTDDANTDLGVYFKFNEGITLTSSIDTVVLDYSGRVSNGTWTGYNLGGGTYSRSTGSAINECSLTNFSGSEFKDPMVYRDHPEFKDFLSTKRKEGKEYDYNNPSNMYYSLPSWLIEEHDANNPDNEGIISNSLWNLTQMFSSYFDDLANQIKSLSSIAQPDYRSAMSGTVAAKPIPFMDRALESKGFISPDIFSGLDALEALENRDKNTLYTQKFYDIKNLIYQNIYNNLTYINKSKGTEKSFRNLVRCFGVDDELYKFNIYSNNVEYTLKDNYRSVAERHKVINFSTLENTEASIYQWSGSNGTPSNPNAVTFISGSEITSLNHQDYWGTQEGANIPFSVEANIIFPNRVDQGDFSTFRPNDTSTRNKYPLIQTASLFGMHTAVYTSAVADSWAANDYANFVVKAIKPETYTQSAYFVLTGTADGFIPELSSSVFDEVYADKNWSFLVSIYPEQYPNANQVSGTGPSLNEPEASGGTVTVEFSGIHNILDTTVHEFTVTGSMTAEQAVKFLVSSKRMFVGAHRTNFTGSVIDQTDIKFNNFRVWLNKLSLSDLRSHASNPSNYGISKPADNAYLFNTSVNHTYVPNKETLLLHWDFTNVTGSDVYGEFIVDDLTSGSVTPLETPRYGWLGARVKNQYTGKAIEFEASSADVYEIEDIITAKPNLPEVMGSDDTITVMSNDDVYYTRDKRPTYFDLYVEKSPYQNISEEMMKFMSTVKDFNDLFGRPVDRYRDEYKALSMLRQLFFDRIKNPPDIDKYIEYFKWFDVAVAAMIQKIAPMSTGLDERPLRNVIESHVLERNKYRHKFPTYEFKQTDPMGRIRGLAELTYNWKYGHAPITGSEENNCLWWKERAERDAASSSGDPAVGIPSGDPNADSNRNTMLEVLNNYNNAGDQSFSGTAGSYSGSTYALRRLAKPYRLSVSEARGYHGGVNFSRNKNLDYFNPMAREFHSASGGSGGGDVDQTGSLSLVASASLVYSASCTDRSDLTYKSFPSFWIKDQLGNVIGTGERYAPYTLVSSSMSASQRNRNLRLPHLDFVNAHNDTYGYSKEVPAQGPFTEKYVGGRQHRHVWTSFDPGDDVTNRPEGYRVMLFDPTGAIDKASYWVTEPVRDVSGAFNPHLPRYVFYRDEKAKRPVNIRNIQQTTGTTEDLHTSIGNYTNAYEVVMTNGRSLNNRYLAESEGVISTTSQVSYVLSGVIDFALPRRDLTGTNNVIIVNRFSAPGDPSTMSEGMLDVAAAEYSVYNALPFRNLDVRIPLDRMYSDHTNQFGFFSDAFNTASYFIRFGKGAGYPGGNSTVATADYSGTGSFHKVHRNRRNKPQYSNAGTNHNGIVNTTSSFDNWFVQHQIPQTDIQYAWISGSVTASYTGSALYGFEKPDFSNASYASTDIIFASSSDTGSFGSGHVLLDYVGLNTFVIEDITSSANLLTTGNLNASIVPPAIPDTLETNARLLNRGGTYGGANWKLYRKDNHPIVRVHRKESRLSYLESKDVVIDGGTSILKSQQITSAIEPSITSKYKPLRHNLKIKRDLVTGADVESSLQDISLDHTYLNNIAYFTDHIGDGFDLDQKILSLRNKPTAQQTLDSINYYLFEGELPGYLNPINEFKSLEIKETIFPRGQYTYLSGTRQRTNFENGFWKETRADRDSFGQNRYNPFLDVTDSMLNTGLKTVFDFTITCSCWPLDARIHFATGSPGRIKSGSDEGKDTTTDSATAWQYWPIISGTAQTRPGILQNNVMQYGGYTSLSRSSGYELAKKPSNAQLLPTYNRRIAGVIPSDTTHEYKFGDTKWEAADQSGIKPFYNTYADYVDEIKRTGKDHGILPEFRMSEHMDYYLNQKGGDFLAINTASFSITGSAISSSAESVFFKTYSHTDFLKTFSIVNNDYQNIAKPDSITLSVDALVKFLPYDGFYPADRTVQLAKLFWDSYNSSFIVDSAGDGIYVGSTPISPGVEIEADDAGYIRPIWNAFFSPGVLYNSIKSGIAVDYPIHTASAVSGFSQVSGSPNIRHQNGYLTDIPRIASKFPFRVPFEALVDPEGHLVGVQVIDSEPHPSASLDLTCSIAAAGKLNYKLAMHNFLASTIDFWKEDGKMTTIASLPDNDPAFGNVEPVSPPVSFTGFKEYKMRIVCYNSQFSNTADVGAYISDKGIGALLSASFDWNPSNLTMYEQTGSDPSAPTPSARQSDYYGSSFGPPVWDNSYNIAQASAVSPNYGSASFEPFTPAYYDGYGHIELTYRPSFSDDDLPSIISQLTQSAARYSTGWYLLQRLSEPGSALKNRMNLSASINHLQMTSVKNVVFDAIGNPIEVGGDAAGGAFTLTIQPKWESPILNFKNVDVTLPEIGSGSVARGMWHQYGVIPKDNEGVFLQVQDIVPEQLDDSNTTGSLADLLGLSKKPVAIGKIAKQKKISEAIVAIPFFTGFLGSDVQFTIPREVIDLAEEFVDKKGNSATYEKVTGQNPKLKPDQSVIDMVSKMKKFVLPPKFDFITNKDVDPFAMFIFDFDVALSQQDLANIWQNLSPDIGTSFKKKTASLPTSIFAPSDEKGTGLMGSYAPFGDLAGVGGLPENVQWMVFKVKQKAAYNYFAKTADSKDDDRFKFNFEIGARGAEKTSVPDYSYNWPFDFFSLIELAKIEAEIDMKPIEGVQVPKIKPFETTVEEALAATVYSEFAGDPAKKLPPKGSKKKKKVTKKDKTGTGQVGSTDLGASLKLKAPKGLT